jgi:hypothetical protein
VSRLLAVTEDKTPWLVAIDVTGGAAGVGGAAGAGGAGGAEKKGSAEENGGARATIAALTPVRFPADVQAWRGDSNFRLEGCAIDDDGKTVYLSFERSRDDQPRILEVPAARARSGEEARLEEVPFPFAGVPAREGKPGARLNLNDIQFLRRDGRRLLIALARDQERVLVLDIAERSVAGIVDLDLRGPDGRSLEWASPEGLAADPASDRLWIITDPDSVRGNYKARGEAEATGEFASYSPLLFELKLSAALGEAPR